MCVHVALPILPQRREEQVFFELKEQRGPHCVGALIDVMTEQGPVFTLLQMFECCFSGLSGHSICQHCLR